MNARIVITGGSSGIGKALSEYFTNAGENVICIDRSHGYDLSTVSGIETAIKRINERTTTVLVNNAGIMPFEDQLTWESAEKTMRLNVMAVWYLMKNVQISTPGNIINIASIAGINHDEDTALYSATKAAVISLTKSYAKIYARLRIRVNSISPGLFSTNLVPEPTPDWLINKVPLKYEEQPENLCRVVDMILNTEYMTGANIVVDGGLSL